jgi:hypothetical protein
LLAFTVGCGASINDAYKADVDRRVSALHGTGTSYPAVDGFEPMPLAVGQWIEFKVVDDKHNPSFMKYSVVGEQGGAFWIETIHKNYYHTSETRMLVAFGDRSDPATYDVRAFEMRTDGKGQDYPPGMLGLLKSLYKPILNNLVVNWKNLPREDAKVIAGDFAGCFKQRTSVSFGPYDQTSDGWSHPSVPINGMVRSEGVDKPFKMELIAFGTAGAKSVF